MNFWNTLRYFVLSKPNDRRAGLPANWPSNLHSKCDVVNCFFPNPPQAVKGRYNCLGVRGVMKKPCEGTYKVSAEMADCLVWKAATRRTTISTQQERPMSSDSKHLGYAQNEHLEHPPFKIKSKLTIKSARRREEYYQHKDLPPIPGLSQRKVNRGPITTTPPPPLPSLIQRQVSPGYTASPPPSGSRDQVHNLHINYYFPQENISLSQYSLPCVNIPKDNVPPPRSHPTASTANGHSRPAECSSRPQRPPRPPRNIFHEEGIRVYI